MVAKTNDIYMVLFLSSLIRTVLSLHDLVKVREESLSRKIKAEEEEKKKEEKEKEKEKEKEEKKE